MAYLDRDALSLFIGATLHEPVKAAESLSALEWRVVDLAGRDTARDLRPPSRARKLLQRIFGLSPANKLADPRLESLRRLAICAWRHDIKADCPEVDPFLRSGFSFDQLLLLGAYVRARKIPSAPVSPKIRGASYSGFPAI